MNPQTGSLPSSKRQLSIEIMNTVERHSAGNKDNMERVEMFNNWIEIKFS